MSNKKIVLIENSKENHDHLDIAFAEKGFEISCFANADDFFRYNQNKPTCSIFFRANITPEFSPEKLKKIRDSFPACLLTVILNPSNKDKKFTYLEHGADDIVFTPVEKEELFIKLANYFAKTKYFENHDINKGFRVLEDAQTIMKNGLALQLTPREFTVVKCLVNMRDNVATREDLVSCYDPELSMNVRNVDVLIFALRKKLERLDIKIETVWGKGFKLTY